MKRWSVSMGRANGRIFFRIRGCAGVFLPVRVLHLLVAAMLACFAESVLAQPGSVHLFDRASSLQLLERGSSDQFADRGSTAQGFVSTNQLLTPDKALRAVQRAHEYLIRGQIDSAQKEVTRALDIFPHCA